MSSSIYRGKHVGIPLSLMRIRERIERQFVRGGWKTHYNNTIFPIFEGVLKRHAITQAKEVSLRGHYGSGRLSSSIVIGRGGSGPGRRAFRLVVKGEAAKYARIINWGGTIRPKKAQHLTVPFGDNLDVYGGTGKSLIGSMRKIRKKEGFTIVRKTGPLSGRKIVYLKGKAIDRHGLTAYTPKGWKITERIKPVFELIKFQVIKATNWADKAQEEALKEFDEFSTRAIKEYLERK
jgi:hypothetical protein